MNNDKNTKSLLLSSVFICVHLWLHSVASGEPPEPRFRHQTIDDKIQIGYGVAVADVDGDKKPDILLADKKQFVWYRNPTSGEKWEKFVIAEDLTKRDNVCLAAQDLDGDGKCELAVGADWDPNDRENSGAVFYMIPPEDRTKKWEAVKLPAEPTVHRMRWAALGKGKWGLIVVPLHGRGADGKAGAKVLLYHPPEGVHLEWETELLTDAMHAVHGIEVADGRPRIHLAGREGFATIFRANDNHIDFLSYPGQETRGAGEVASGEGACLAVTIEPMHGNELVAYIGHKPERRVILNSMTEGHALKVGRVFGVAHSQFVVGWRGGRGGVCVVAPADNDFNNWRTIEIDGGMACEDLCLADLDSDGDLDIIASGRATKNVKIYWNETGAK